MKTNSELAGKIVCGFRVVKATDMEMVKKAVTMARVRGAVGGTEIITEVAGPEVLDRAIERMATVERA